jgi:hypothetical protein
VSFTDKDYLNGHFAPPVREGWHSDFLFENAWNRKKMFQFHSLPDNWWKPPSFKYRVYLIERTIRNRLSLEPAAFPTRPREYYADLPYDFPSAPVKCHAPFSHFVLIEMGKLEKIGKCENWSPLPLLVDEDLGLRALELGLNNIWIPDIEYVHCRPPSGGTRGSIEMVREKKRVHKLFFEKWGFLGGKVEELDFIKKKYKNTNIPWSVDRRSYDWDYIR